MKNIKQRVLVGVALLITLGACQSELTNTNVNPNNLESPNVTTLTSNVIANEFWNNTSQGWLYGNGMGQLMSYSQFYYRNLYATAYVPISNSNYWTICYANARDASTIVSQSQKANKTASQAVGLILETFAFSQLTDLWGDVPYSQALQGGSGNYLASYDDQKSIYTAPRTGLLAKLRTADSLLATTTSVITGDVLYNGNVTLWRKFANGLRLRLLLRISQAPDAPNVAAEMQSIVNNSPIFQSASESATLKLPSSTPWYFPSYGDRAGDFNVKYMDSLLYKFYVDTQDQDRLTLFFSPTASAGTSSSFSFSNYGGLPQISSGNDAGGAQASAASLFNSKLNGSINTSFAYSTVTYARIITYAEVQFILAEAALNGYISGGAAQAATYYTNGLLGAYAEYGLPATDANSYAAANPLSATTSTALSQIISQKWALNLNNGYEGLLEYRRTGLPVFDTRTKVNQNDGVVPRKFLYPSDEQNINRNNWTSEVSKMNNSGKDNPNYRAWW